MRHLESIFKRALMDGEVVKQKRNPFSPQATHWENLRKRPNKKIFPKSITE